MEHGFAKTRGLSISDNEMHAKDLTQEMALEEIRHYNLDRH